MSEPKIQNPVTGRLMAAPREEEEVKMEKTEAQIPERVGAAIKELREARGLSQAKLADKLGIAISSLNRWEKGKAIPHNSSLGILDDYFESDLVGRFGAVLKTAEPAADESAAEELVSLTPPEEEGCAGAGKKPKWEADFDNSVFGQLWKEKVSSEALANFTAEVAEGFLAFGLSLTRAARRLQR